MNLRFRIQREPPDDRYRILLLLDGKPLGPPIDLDAARKILERFSRAFAEARDNQERLDSGEGVSRGDPE